MRRTFILIAALLLAAFGPDPEDTPTVEGAIARTVKNALPGSDEVSSGYGWQAVGSRMTYRVHWHLAEREAADATHIRRSGWIEGDDELAGVAVCGQETARLFSFRLNHNVKQARPALLEALREEGVEPEAVSDGWRIAPSWAAPGLLRIEGACTPAGAAAAQRCWTNVYLALREEDRDAFAIECRTP